MLNQKFEGHSRKGGIIEVSFGFVDAQTRAYPSIFYPVNFTRESAKFDEAQDNKAGGTLYKPRLQLRKAQVYKTVNDWIKKNAWQLFICRVRYANGSAMEAGTTEYPLELEVSSTSGKKAADRNGYDFRWKGTTDQPSLFISPQQSLNSGMVAIGNEIIKVTGITMEAGQPVQVDHGKNLDDPYAFMFKLVLPSGKAYTNFQPETVTKDSFTFLAPETVTAPAGATVYLLIFT
ncbi:hypothetical protein BKI52_12465 [marine bacterium AO1-C]|nr:hypothetical protein BKI52_12465 [marine bacterium AO1-C]